MTLTISVDSKNDIYIGENGSLSLSSSIEAVLQAAQQAAQTQLGELVYQVEDGIPNFQVVWNGFPNLVQFEAFLRRTLLAVPDVVEVRNLTSRTGQNKLSYTATIVTSFGIGQING